MRSPSIGAVEASYSTHFHSCRLGSPPPDDALPVEGLRMSTAFEHLPVMVDEVTRLFAPVPPGLVVDATVGGGGHASALLAALPQIRLLGVDRDDEAVAAARTTLRGWGERAVVVHGTFDRLTELVADQDEQRLAGILFDLGVSSHQLDRAERGFSYRSDSPLDMRMDRSQTLTAEDVVNGYPAERLSELVAASGESRFARRVAAAIVAARPISTTGQLAEIVREAIPAAARRRGGHPARRVFQAIRMEVNSELEQLGSTLDVAIGLLAPGGRCVVLAYHSSEDRMVKEHFLTAASGGCICPPGLPCACGARPLVRILNKRARKPTPAEVETNPRSSSARLRACERLSDEAPGSGDAGGSDRIAT